MSQNFNILIKKKIKKFNKKITIDSDKSITHRALFLASQCQGISKIKGLHSEDISSTILGLRKLGIKIINKKKRYCVYGKGIGGYQKFSESINCGNYYWYCSNNNISIKLNTITSRPCAPRSCRECI